MSILQIKLTSVASVRQHSTKGFEESEMDFSENSTGDGNVYDKLVDLSSAKYFSPQTFAFCSFEISKDKETVYMLFTKHICLTITSF